MTPRAVLFFRFLLFYCPHLLAPCTHPLAIPTLGYSYGPIYGIYGMDGKVGGGPTVQEPRVGLRDYMSGTELQEHANLNNAIVGVIRSIHTVLIYCIFVVL
jgi:hypothetical protein